MGELGFSLCREVCIFGLVKFTTVCYNAVAGMAEGRRGGLNSRLPVFLIMGYQHIDNLYRAQEILAFRTCFATEKIHGTSANIQWKDGHVRFSSGSEKHERFVELFDATALAAKFAERFLENESVVVHGEAYGDKCQRMSETYGAELRFVAFEVKVGDVFLAVPQAFEFVTFLGLEFVDFTEIPATMEAIDAERDKPSTQAIRNGTTESKIREGIVLRPPFECVLNNGKRVMAKHKRDEFAERGSPNLAEIDPSKRELMENAQAIALEWVTPMRLMHVIDRLVSIRTNKEVEITDTGKIIELMVEDVTREAEGEIADNQAVRRAIGGAAARMFKQHLASALEGSQ